MNTNNAAALLPCPFCGKQPRVIGPSCKKSDPYRPGDHAFPLVRCCQVDVHGDDWDYSRESAVRNWNSRYSFAQPDALTSQPSGEALPVGEVSEGFIGPHRGVKLYGPSRDHPAPGTKLYTHPSADAPGVAVDEAMVERAMDAILDYGVLKLETDWETDAAAMRAALTAALAPKPEGE